MALPEPIHCPIPLKEGFLTTGELLTHHGLKNPDKPFMGWFEPGTRKLCWLNWGEAWKKALILGSTLLNPPYQLEIGEKVAFLCENRVEMALMELVVTSLGGVSVPIFSGYFPDKVNFIINHSDARFLICSTPSQAHKVFFQEVHPQLEKVFILDNFVEGEFPNHFYSADILFQSEPDQKRVKVRFSQTPQDNPLFIMYTSGTTGEPKGVVLTHKNILSQQAAISQVWDLSPDERFLSYLPWHHSFGGLFERFMALYHGSSLVCDDSFGKDLDLLIENWKKVLPTLYFSVPKTYQALVTRILNHPELENELIHPELKFVFTAAAPLPDTILKFFTSRGIVVHEGWGLTETSPCVTLTRPGSDKKSGFVGEPLPGCSLTFSKGGEIWVKGPNLMKGYYKDVEKTDLVIDSSGWFHTGDLGNYTPEGLKILGRLDGVFKLLNAEKVSSLNIEHTLLSTQNLCQQVVAVGSGKPFVSAVVFPDFPFIEKKGKDLSLTWRDRQELLEHPLILEMFLKLLDEGNGLLTIKYEKIKSLFLVPREISFEKGELTPSGKVVRKKVLEIFSREIEDLYNKDEPEKIVICQLNSIMAEEN